MALFQQPAERPQEDEDEDDDRPRVRSPRQIDECLLSARQTVEDDSDLFNEFTSNQHDSHRSPQTSIRAPSKGKHRPSNGSTRYTSEEGEQVTFKRGDRVCASEDSRNQKQDSNVGTRSTRYSSPEGERLSFTRVNMSCASEFSRNQMQDSIPQGLDPHIVLSESVVATTSSMRRYLQSKRAKIQLSEAPLNEYDEMLTQRADSPLPAIPKAKHARCRAPGANTEEDTVRTQSFDALPQASWIFTNGMPQQPRSQTDPNLLDALALACDADGDMSDDEGPQASSSSDPVCPRAPPLPRMNQFMRLHV